MRQGQAVAVCCDDCFYIGQVLLPIRPNLAKVQVIFMEQRGMENAFKWPGSDATEQADCSFVCFWDFTIIPNNRVDCSRRLGNVETEAATAAD